MALFGKKKKEQSTASELKISVKNDGKEYTLTLDGRLDTLTSPSLEAKVNEVVGDADKLIIDLGALSYISSAGLRVLLGAAQIMEDKGEMIVCSVTQPIREVFALTGFNRVFKIV